MQRSESIIKAERAGWLTTVAAEDTNVVEAVLDDSNGRLDDVFAEVQRRGILIVPFVVGKSSTLAAALEAAELAVKRRNGCLFIGIASADWAEANGIYDDRSPQRRVERLDSKT